MTSRINRSSWTSSGSRGSPAPAPGHKPQRHKSNTPSPTRLLLTRQDLDQLGGSLFAERDWSHRDNVDGRRRLQSCPTDRGHSPPPLPPLPHRSDRLTADLGSRGRDASVHGAVLVRLGNFLCLRNHQETLVGVFGPWGRSALRLSPASALRSQIAHFPFSTDLLP